MVGMKRKGSLGRWAMACGLLVAFAALGTGAARAESGDQPASPPSLFELMKPSTPSAEQAISESVHDGALAPPAAGSDCARHSPGGSKKKRPSLSTALKSGCTPAKAEHDASPATDKP
jgi:hypothetical protein